MLTVPDKLRAATLWENLSAAELVEHALKRGEAALGPEGQIIVDTRPHTGRSPKDKFFVREPGSETHIDWGDVNQPIDEARFDALFERVQEHLRERDVYALDCYVGADERFRLPVRVYTELAWQSLFARHLFITPERLPSDFVPEFTVVDAALFQADPERDGTRTGTFVIVNFRRRMILIGGTRYAGEIKKSVFTVMNYLLPLRESLPMHCSANVGEAGDLAIFFGLSGTGKTTLSSDSHRPLVGDDEHVLGRRAIPRRDQPNRRAAQVHERRRLDEHDAARRVVGLACGILVLPSLDAQAFREFVDDHEAEVVARPFVLAAGIAEAHDDGGRDAGPHALGASASVFSFSPMTSGCASSSTGAVASSS